MVAYLGETDYSHRRDGVTGILVTNLGTPDAPDASSVRRYLAEFLSDPRVIEVPRLLWLVILHGVILRVRPRRSAAAYRKVWSKEGSPLLVISRRQAEALQKSIEQHFAGPVKVALAMRYGSPSIAEGLEVLREAGARRLLVLPLYPQYAAATTASTFDAVAAALRGWRWLPELRFVNHYHDHAGYLDALANSIREAWQQEPPASRLLFSFHGLPKRYLLDGDPYFCECHKTARLLADRLALEEDAWMVSFQSRVGREEWLRPYTDELLAAWGKEGVDRVDVVCPGFSADCLETLEELAMQNQEMFQHAGGSALRYIPALNDRADHIEALTDVVTSRTDDWQRLAPHSDDQRDRTRERAMAMGAKD